LAFCLGINIFILAHFLNPPIFSIRYKKRLLLKFLRAN
jgi:hypothetical protein